MTDNGLVYMEPLWGMKEEKLIKMYHYIQAEKIIGLHPISFNYDGEGMHCRYQTQPKIE